MSEQGIVVNKYGAVDAQEIMRMQGRVLQLERIIAKMAGIEDYAGGSNRIDAFNYPVALIYELPETFEKMKELTKCDDYKYQTTPKAVKLVKIVRKQAKDE